MYHCNHREHNNEKNVLVARFLGMLLLAPPAAAAAKVGCLGPARRSGNGLYSSWESVVLRLCTAVITDNTRTKTMFQLRAFAVRCCLLLHLLLLLLLLLTAVLAATDAVVLLFSNPPTAAGSGAAFVQKTVSTRAVVLILVCYESRTRDTKTLRLELPTTHVYQNTDLTSHSV